MKDLKDYICESLLDDEEDITFNSDKEMLKTWLDDNLIGNYSYVLLKNGYLKFRGDVVIKNYKEDTLPTFLKISSMKGNFSIEKCPNLIGIDDLFVKYAEVDGDYHINNCPKLTSVMGGPWIVKGSLSFTGNTSLKSLEGSPEMVGEDTYILKNGKKFSENVIKKYINTYERIVCSVDNEDVLESVINEALNEPHLLELANQLKKTHNTYTRDFSTIFHSRTLPWDDMDSSNVKEYKRINDETLKAVRKVISSADGKGIVLLKDRNKYVAAIDSNKYGICLDDSWYTKTIADNGYGFGFTNYWNNVSYTYIMQMIKQSTSIVIIEYDDNMINSIANKRDKRLESRAGMVKNTPEYYEKVAKENLERYRKIIAQNKLKKDKDSEYIDKEVESILMTVIKITKEARQNPNKYPIWELKNLHEEIYGESVYTNAKTGYVGHNGLMKLYSEYNEEMVRMIKYAESSNMGIFSRGMSDKYMKNIEKFKKEIILKIDKIKDYIKYM